MTKNTQADVVTEPQAEVEPQAETTVTEETTATEAVSSQTPIQALIVAIDAHEAEGAKIDADMTALGLDAKKVKAIRRAEKASAAAKLTLDALMGVGAVTAGKVSE